MEERNQQSNHRIITKMRERGNYDADKDAMSRNDASTRQHINVIEDVGGGGTYANRREHCMHECEERDVARRLSKLPQGR